MTRALIVIPIPPFRSFPFLSHVPTSSILRFILVLCCLNVLVASYFCPYVCVCPSSLSSPPQLECRLNVKEALSEMLEERAAWALERQQLTIDAVARTHTVESLQVRVRGYLRGVMRAGAVCRPFMHARLIAWGTWGIIGECACVCGLVIKPLLLLLSSPLSLSAPCRSPNPNCNPCTTKWPRYVKSTPPPRSRKRLRAPSWPGTRSAAPSKSPARRRPRWLRLPALLVKGRARPVLRRWGAALLPRQTSSRPCGGRRRRRPRGWPI